MSGPISRLLVANRAEIAVRIMRSAALAGIRTVAVAPEDDAACAHVARADTAVRLPGSGPAAYLDVEAVVGAALETGCDALHPGYGFLAEQPALAAACADAGVTFVGPSPEALALFGDKTRARAHAASLGLPLAAATSGPTDLDAATAFFDGLGPGATVMVKAVAGGGGRGMRPVTRREHLPDAFARCRSEAQAAFGDGAVFVEQLLGHARHVEVQVIGDGTGAVVALGDRDCSLQRRRQKLVEVAPAPRLAPSTRRRLHDAAVAVTAAVSYRGLATVEFLVVGEQVAFLEVNPRIQVEHTVTEEVTGLDLVDLGLRVAGGAGLGELGLAAGSPTRGGALQLRVNTETVHPDGTLAPSAGVLLAFSPPGGPGVRVDTHAYPGYPVSPRYDSLLAKLVVSDPSGDADRLAQRAAGALAELVVEGVDTNAGFLRAVIAAGGLSDPQVDTTWVDDRLPALVAAADGFGSRPAPEPDAPARPGSPDRRGPDGTVAVPAPTSGTVVEVLVGHGDAVAEGATVAVLEAMKMEHLVRAPQSGIVRLVAADAGQTLSAGDAIAHLEPSELDGAATAAAAVDLGHVRADLAETIERHRVGLDEGRPAAVTRRHDKGRRTARENIDDLCDAGSFLEIGALALAAQRRRRSLADLIANTPADGLVAGTATVGGRPCAVMSYDYTVLAGTQGLQNHRKTDRLLDLAARRGLPLVIFAEGGGGRPGDTDTASIASLDVPTFRMASRLAGTVPTVAVVSGYCFAGNAALAGVCDVIIATEGSSLGMGGPAMIEGGGLGVVAPGEVGPMDVQVANGVVDVLVRDDAAAVDAARRYLEYFSGQTVASRCRDQRLLRHLVPENRVRAYAIRQVVETLVDEDSMLELRSGWAAGIVTALARIEGRAVGVIANNPEHLGGAIDAEAADKATRFFQLCDAHGLPVVSLCDTPGFMVGPDAERTATVRRFGAMFVAGSRTRSPMVTVVLRKGYGLGAMAMAGGDLKAPLLTVSWPTGEFGGMGLEGGVRLGYRKELEAIDDPAERQARYEQLVADAYDRGKGLSAAAAFEIDDVIDPAATRSVIARALAAGR
ncbi:ATP-grasp domain-containing protein [Acidiferrimicrobium sp. IK]|uniref:acetyl-CoA carboxylase family protein n=1 Tax=Acidiferrimicrobium sp. IK TaxID=2871700 RepID=UPI002916F0CD|nr:carboxyl transferase domain-containing protein [Acidiferrimicrobium sp. IK]MCU4186816.1 ATP-grasp domain-containing protein [Acidiferrimicrobium sp. IK]